MNIATLKFKLFAFNVFIVASLILSTQFFITTRVKKFLTEEREESRKIVNKQAAFVALATVLGGGGARAKEELFEYLSEYPDLTYCVTISLYATYYKDGLCFIKNETLAREYNDLFLKRPVTTDAFVRDNMLNILSPVHRINDEGEQEIAGYILSGFSLESIINKKRTIVKIIMRIGLAILILSILISYFMTSLFMKPINNAVKVIDNVAKGDFTSTISTKSKSEIGKLINTINRMVSVWRSSIVKTMEVIDQTSKSAEKMSDTTRQQEKITSEQASAVNEITTTVDELNASSKQVYEKAEQVSQSSDDVLKIAFDGKRAVKDSVEEIDAIRDKVKAISEHTLNLSVEAQQISSIVKTVSDIANKTDMLAINAGIEAARAGEHGKGFAIVATEVRELADQSKKSVEKIAVLLENIQSATNTTVLSTEEALKGFQIGIKLILEAGKTIENLIKHTQETVNYASEIALASRQQSLGTEQVASVMTTINEGMRTAANSAAQILDEANNLKKLGIDLSGVVENYKI